MNAFDHANDAVRSSKFTVAIAIVASLSAGAATVNTARAQQPVQPATRSALHERSGATMSTSSSHDTTHHSDRRIPIAKEHAKPRARVAASQTMPAMREPMRANVLSIQDTLIYRPDSMLARRTTRVDSGSSKCCLWGALAFPLVLAHQFQHGGTVSAQAEADRFIPAGLPTPRPMPKGSPYIPGYPSLPIEQPTTPTTPSSDQPGTPNAPSSPTSPASPGDPGNASDPSTPGAPGTPGNPGNPSSPGNPSQPSDPSNPSNNPGDPDDPSSPWVPNTPSDPGLPGTPGTAGIPGAPWSPPPNQSGSTPAITATPEPTTILMLGSGLSMLGLGAGFRGRRRRSTESTKEQSID